VIGYNGLSEEHDLYLRVRGYHDRTIAKERPWTVIGPSLYRGELEIEAENAIAWPILSAAGTLVGVHFRETPGDGWDEPTGLKYFSRLVPGLKHIPLLYATREDHEIFYDTGEVCLCEGVLDRIVLKRAKPEWAVFARLTKGVGIQVARYLRRRATRIWTCFDMDEWGRRGTKKTKRIMAGVEVLSIEYPAKDPGQLWIDKGPLATREFLRREIQLLDW